MQLCLVALKMLIRHSVIHIIILTQKVQIRLAHVTVSIEMVLPFINKFDHIHCTCIY